MEIDFSQLRHHCTREVWLTVSYASGLVFFVLLQHHLEHMFTLHATLNIPPRVSIGDVLVAKMLSMSKSSFVR